MKISFCFLVFLLFNSYLFSQSIENIEEEFVPRKKDTACYNYVFNPGDTITYRATATDSIIIDYGTPLIKQRYELIRIVCDSVNKKTGRIFLSQELLNYISEESWGENKGIMRTESPWIGRKVWYEIDSVGTRYSYGVDDSTRAAMSPGGAFQPNIIIPFKNRCKITEESWSYSGVIDLPENGFPVPVERQSTLFRAMPSKDTLGYPCYKFQYIRSAQGAVTLLTNDVKIYTSTINISHGEMFFHKEFNIPVHYYANIEQKLTIDMPTTGKQPGVHYMIINYVLDEYKPAKKIKK